MPEVYTLIPNAIFDYWMPRLSFEEFAVLICICSHIFKEEGDEEEVSFETMQEGISIKEKKVFKKCLKVLEGHRLIKVSKEQISFA